MMQVNASAYILHKEKVLLIQRDLNDTHFPGHWGVPGGGMEERDLSLEETVIREVREEVGLDVVPLRVRFNNRNKDVLFVELIAHLADENDYGKSLDTSDEVHDYRWATVEDVADLTFTPFTKERLFTVFEELSLE